MSRTKNTLKNTASGFFIKILYLILHFASRTIFVYDLGNEFLSINGLFTSIFSFLNITELGIGSAIVFAMYEPIAKNDKNKIKQYLLFYKKIYNLLGFIVIIIGFLLLPFINYLIPENTIKSFNVYLILILFVASSSCSYYFYVNRLGFLSAMQQEYRLTLSNSLSQIFTLVFQIVSLVLFHNYYLYLTVPIVALILLRYSNGINIGKWYPYIKEKPFGELSKEERKEVFKNTYGLAINKISATLNNAVDNIVITTVIGLAIVGPYSNYLLIINMISGFTSIAFVAVRPSVGNLHASSDIEHKKKVFNYLRFFALWIYGFCAICYVCLIQQFIPMWLGESYLMSLPLAIMVALNYLVVGLNAGVSTFREGCGLYYIGRYRPIITALLNILLSIIFGKLWGTTGIIGATTLSLLLTTVWYDALIVYKNVFKENFIPYLIRYTLEIIQISIIGLVIYFVCSLITEYSVLSLIIRGFICIIMFNVIFWIIYHKSTSYQHLMSLANNLIKRKA